MREALQDVLWVDPSVLTAYAIVIPILFLVAIAIGAFNGWWDTGGKTSLKHTARDLSRWAAVLAAGAIVLVCVYVLIVT